MYFMYYLIGGLLLFGLINFSRYLVLYHFQIFTKGEEQEATFYDIGSLIKKCRNKKFQSQSLNTLKQSKNSRSELPLTPVISDSALAGANVFHQYMLIDDYMYEGISKLSGKQIDNFSDLSSKIEDYSDNYNGLTGHSLNKIKGHIAESHVADHLKEAGAEISWPDTSNQEGWDLLLNENPIQVKCIKDAKALTEHFKEHPDIPVVIPSDADNIPETVFHFDPSEGVKNLIDYVEKNSEAVIVDHQFSHAELTENIEQRINFVKGDIDFTFPFITAAFSSFREFHLLRKGDTDILSSFKNAGLDISGVGIGMVAGQALGATMGSLIFPGIGTLIGYLSGSIGGAFLGRKITNKIKNKPLKTAMENYEESFRNLKKQIKQTEKKYGNWFKQEKKREQDHLNELSYTTKNKIDLKIKDLRKQRVKNEEPSETFKNNLLNNIPVTITSIKKVKKLNWIEYFWPKQKTINYQQKMKRMKKLLTKQFQNNKFKDRGQLLQKFAEQGLCREYILFEIEKTEEKRREHENNAIKEIRQHQEELLNQRYESIKKLSDKITEYIQKIRKELSPYIKEIQNYQNIVKKEAEKLGKNVTGVKVS